MRWGTLVSRALDLTACEAPVEVGGGFEGTEVDEMAAGKVED